MEEGEGILVVVITVVPLSDTAFTVAGHPVQQEVFVEVANTLTVTTHGAVTLKRE